MEGQRGGRQLNYFDSAWRAPFDTSLVFHTHSTVHLFILLHQLRQQQQQTATGMDL